MEIKYVAKNYNELAFPFRRYQIGKVYRGERPQKGRFREFYQCDIDVIGNESLSLRYDAEIPSIIYDIFKKLDFGKFVIRINPLPNEKNIISPLIVHFYHCILRRYYFYQRLVWYRLCLEGRICSYKLPCSRWGYTCLYQGCWW